ncbi:MAG: hypothetical protein RMM51_02190, partial [Verrucomicrobiae bacterium]|nr:hypothetical protein [Verrucomicrobiae bacterium]
HQELARKAASHAQRESLRQDFARIEEFVMDEIEISRHKAVALFSCSGHQFWQAYRLPRMVRNLLIADTNPYVRPLVAMLSEYRRFGVAVLDRVRAAFYEVYMREIRSLGDVTDDVPRRVKEGGLGGREERHIERRHAAAVQQHYRHVAQQLFRLLQQYRFDRIALGGARDVLREFKPHLHPYLRQRWANDFHLDVHAATPDRVLQEVLRIEDQIEALEEQRVVEELLARTEKHRAAVAGIGPTLEAVARGEAQILVVDSGLELPGYLCPRCHRPLVEEETCPQCQTPTEPCADIVDELIELAVQKNCQIRHVHGPSPLRDLGRVGALLRYQS